MQAYIHARMHTCPHACMHGGGRGEWGDVVFRGVSPSISGNVLKLSGGCCQAFREMFSSILGSVAGRSGECGQAFRVVLPRVPGECPVCFGGGGLVGVAAGSVGLWEN